MTDRRIDVFCARVSEGLATEISGDADPEARLDDLLVRARGGRPSRVSDATLLAYIADRLPIDAAVGDIEALNLGDLGLACGCAHGDDEALREFERDYAPELKHVIRKVAGSDNDDILQALRTRLFVAEPGELPRITGYSGRGRLFSWLRVVAVRETLSLLRKNKREVLLGDAIPEAAIDDLELGVFKGLYQREFKAAFETAVAELSSRERNILRLHLIDKLSIDAIGAANNAHRTSAARWLRDVRAKLANRTRDLLGESLELSDGDLESVMRLVRSRLELSVSRLLGANT